MVGGGWVVGGWVVVGQGEEVEGWGGCEEGMGREEVNRLVTLNALLCNATKRRRKASSNGTQAAAPGEKSTKPNLAGRSELRGQRCNRDVRCLARSMKRPKGCIEMRVETQPPHRPEIKSSIQAIKR